jgi:biopolymer transport protein ExbB
MESYNVNRVRFWGLACAILMALLAGAPVQAQPAGASEAASSAVGNYFDFFVVKGGYIAFGLIALSVVTIALTVEHCTTIRRASIVPPRAIERTGMLLDEKQYLEAIHYTADEPSMVGVVLHSALTEAPNGYGAMERAVEETLDERSARLFRKIEYLNIIGNVAPMIGLFGTVVGMILLFAEIHAADAFPGARVVADRVAVALITTFWGLAVAIPALSIYGIFRNRIDVLTAECALVVEHLLAPFRPGAETTAPDQTRRTNVEASGRQTAKAL